MAPPLARGAKSGMAGRDRDRRAIASAEQIKGSAQRALLADESKRYLEEDDRTDEGGADETSIRNCRSFAEALAVTYGGEGGRWVRRSLPCTSAASVGAA